MRITLTMSTDIIHFRNFSISRIPARLLLPFSITASKGSIQRTAWQYVIELAAVLWAPGYRDLTSPSPLRLLMIITII